MSSIPLTNKFGTFGGVFTPCVLTILGVIMFLRFSEVVGQSGLIYALLIVLGAKAITTLTAFSLSAIATNTRVKGGGAYFLISRSLGAEFGAIIGIVFFLAQAVSVSMYIVGFAEAFQDSFPGTGFSAIQIATLVNIVTFICVYIGAGWATKVQYGILAILLLAVAAFFVGASMEASFATLSQNLHPAFREGDSFFTMFALFFPAVTGIMAGANMSGDLSDPGKSIPAGTLWAILITSLIYLGMAVMLAASRPQAELVANTLVVKQISVSSFYIVCGIFAATLSSALASMMGAPRILQAFARDDIISHLRYFAKGSSGNDEPRRATTLTFIVAQSGIMLGDLNTIAPVITMFFMITYGTLNLACFFEGIVRNPSYRPTFRFSHWSLALLGSVSCVLVMFLISPLWAVAATLLMITLYSLFSRIEMISRWGDLKSGRAYERARKALLMLEQQSYHPKNWRPAILALSGGAWSRLHLAEYAYWLASGQGIMTIGQILPAAASNNLERRGDAENRLRKFIYEQDLRAFPVVVIEERLSEGLKVILQSHGIGGLRPNTVLLGLTTDKERWPEFCQTLRIAQIMQRSILIVDCLEDTQPWTPPEGRIDILWRGEKHGALMLLLAHMLKSNREWRLRQLRILATIPPRGIAENYQKVIKDILVLARIDATVHVFESENPEITLAQRTGNTAVVFVPFEPPAEEDEDAFYEWVLFIRRLTPDVIMVYNAGGVQFEV